MPLFTRPAVVGGITATRPMRRALLVLLTDATNITGTTISETAGVAPRLVDGCLDRLNAAGWIVSESHPGRRLHRLTPTGWTHARELLGLDKPEAHRG